MINGLSVYSRVWEAKHCSKSSPSILLISQNHLFANEGLPTTLTDLYPPIAAMLKKYGWLELLCQ